MNVDRPLPAQEQFEERVGAPFYLRGFEQPLSLTLTEVKTFVRTERQQNYCLIFRENSGTANLTQGTYELAADGMDEFVLFLVPSRRDETGLYLDAVVNLIANN